MRRLLASGVALALAVLILAALARTPAAQTGSQGPAACDSEEKEVRAADLAEAAPGECPVAGATVVDGAARAVLPPPGEGVYVEALTTDGAQELEVRRLPDGGVELGHVGIESGEAGDAAGAERPATSARTGAPGQCRDGAYRSTGRRVVEGLRYRVNWKTIPGELSRSSAVTAIRRAGGNVSGTANECGMGDRVAAFASYEGHTSRSTDRENGSCRESDGVSVAAFGKLPSSVAVTCTYFGVGAGPDEVKSADILMDKADFRWTTEPRSRSCRARYDVEAVMTHEWGHAFGLGHVLPREHANLTMAPFVGTCQASERSLGRGDVLGLDVKYP